MSGDLTRIEPPERVIELRTLRLGVASVEPCVTFTAADETRARALIAAAERAALCNEREFRTHVLHVDRSEKALDLICVLSDNISHAAFLRPGYVWDLQKKWEALLAAILAEKIAGAGERK